jgi:hypothetical protein
LCESITNDKLKQYEDTKFFGKEASLLDGSTDRGGDIYDVYAVVGKKNGSGGCIEGSGLFELMLSQPDFVNEAARLVVPGSVPAGWLSTDADLQPIVSSRAGWRGY